MVTAAKKKKKGKASSDNWRDEDVELAYEALLDAVENVNVSEEPFLAIQPFLRLFVSSNLSKSLRPGLSNRDQKTLLLYSVIQMGKAHLRRFCGGLDAIVNLILNTQAHVPPHWEEYDEDDEEIPNDPESSKAARKNLANHKRPLS